MKNKIITTAAFPFIPAEINMAHMASTYIPADIFHRFMNSFGHESFLVSATDVHGVWVKRELKNAVVCVEDHINSFHSKYQRIFKSLSIDFSNYGRTDSTVLYDLVSKSLIALKENGYIYKKKSKSYYCNECLEYLPKRFRLANSETTQTGKVKAYNLENQDMVCGFCMSREISEAETEHWFMDITKGKDIIKNAVEKQKNNKVKTYLQSVINEGLVDWDFTRDNYYGIKIPFGEDNQYVYLWYDSLVGYLSLIPSEHDKNHIVYRHFMGKNIIYYHGIVWPLILKEGLNSQTMDFQISARGFLNLSASDKELINIEEAVGKYEPDYLRFYISYRTPDSFNDFTFTINEMKQIINNILCRQVGGFFNRCKSILQKNNVVVVPDCKINNEIYENVLGKIKLLLDDMDINKVLLVVIGYIKQCGNMITSQSMYKNPTVEQLALLCNIMAGGLILIAPFIPGIVNDYNIFEGFSLNSIDNIQYLGGKKIKYNEKTWRQMDE